MASSNSGSRPEGRRPAASGRSSSRPASGRPSSSRSSSSRPSSDRSDRPSRPSSSRPSSDRPSRPSSDRPRSDRPYSDRSDRPSRPSSDRPRGDRPYSDRSDRPSRPSSDRPSSDRPAREDRPRREWSRDDRPKASDDRRGARPDRDARGGRAQTNGRFSDRDDRAPRAPRGEKRVNVQDPIIPDHITGQELPRAVKNELRTLPDGLALRVARHLVASGEAIDIDPELAWQHAKAALNKASRVGIVREAAAEAAYHAGHFAEALLEFRAARRMRGIKEYWPLMADCERALGRPTKAIQMAGDPLVATLDKASRVEMRIVASGARADLGQWDAALATLQCPELTTTSAEPWACRIRYAYADVLANMGHNEEAIEWFHRAAAVDAESITDADERIAQLEGTIYEDLDDLTEYVDTTDED